MNNFFIKSILHINKKYFFKKQHPFNKSKNWVLNINYSDFEYEQTKNLLDMYGHFIDLNILKNKNILEIWCWGWGKSVYLSENYNSEVTGIDLSENFISQAIEKAKDKKVDKKTHFFLKDALDTGFEADKFDIIILSDVIEHIPNTEALLKESLRILKPKGIILFDFAPYFHYFWHHIWDTVQIPWLHLFTTEGFRIKLYKKSIEWFVDWDKRISLRIWKNRGRDSFTYLNKIMRKDFERIISKLIKENNVKTHIKYYMLKNQSIFSKIPFIREVFIRHIVWTIKK